MHSVSTEKSRRSSARAIVVNSQNDMKTSKQDIRLGDQSNDNNNSQELSLSNKVNEGNISHDSIEFPFEYYVEKFTNGYTSAVIDNGSSVTEAGHSLGLSENVEITLESSNSETCTNTTNLDSSSLPSSSLSSLLSSSISSLVERSSTPPGNNSSMLASESLKTPNLSDLHHSVSLPSPYSSNFLDSARETVDTLSIADTNEFHLADTQISNSVTLLASHQNENKQLYLVNPATLSKNYQFTQKSGESDDISSATVDSVSTDNALDKRVSPKKTTQTYHAGDKHTDETDALKEPSIKKRKSSSTDSLKEPSIKKRKSSSRKSPRPQQKRIPTRIKTSKPEESVPGDDTDCEEPIKNSSPDKNPSESDQNAKQPVSSRIRTRSWTRHMQRERSPSVIEIGEEEFIDVDINVLGMNTQPKDLKPSKSKPKPINEPEPKPDSPSKSRSRNPPQRSPRKSQNAVKNSFSVIETEIKNQMKDELIKKVKEDLTREFRDIFKANWAQQVVGQLFNEVVAEVKEEVKKELKREVWERLRQNNMRNLISGNESEENKKVNDEDDEIRGNNKSNETETMEEIYNENEYNEKVSDENEEKEEINNNEDEDERNEEKDENEEKEVINDNEDEDERDNENENKNEDDTEVNDNSIFDNTENQPEPIQEPLEQDSNTSSQQGEEVSEIQATKKEFIANQDIKPTRRYSEVQIDIATGRPRHVITHKEHRLARQKHRITTSH